MDDHPLGAVDDAARPMEHALVVGEGKEKAEDQKEKGIGKRLGETGCQEAGYCKENLDQKNVAFLEVPEL